MSDHQTRLTAFRSLQRYLAQATSATTPLTLTLAKALLKKTQAEWIKLEGAHNVCLSRCVDDAAALVQESTFVPMEETHLKLTCLLDDFMSNNAPPSTTTTTGALKLPKLDITRFDGEPANWTSFRDLFTASVGNNSSISDAQKLQYLKGYLGEKPAALIRGLSITNANYAEAWKLLEERYDNQREIISSLVNKILDQRPLKSESATQLRSLLETTEECIRTLDVLKRPVAHWDDMLVIIITKKLDNNTRREWGIRKSTTTMPTFKELKDFLTSYINGLELTTNPQQQPAFQPGQQRKHNARVNHASANAACSICNGSHYNFQCEKLRSTPMPERKRLVASLRLCFNCLRDHPVKDCHSKARCRQCNGLHHTLLHPDGNHNPPRVNKGSSAPPTDGGDGATSTHLGHVAVQDDPDRISANHVSTSRQVLLATAIVEVQDHLGGYQLCRVFLDSGAQCSFASEACIQQLGLPRQRSDLMITGISGQPATRAKGKTWLRLRPRSADLSCAEFSVEAHVLPKVTGNLPNALVNPTTFPHLNGLTLADPQWFKPGRVDILLGGDVFARLMLSGRRLGPEDLPVAQETVFGWIISGPAPTLSHTIQCYPATVDMDQLVRRFWKLDTYPTKPILSKEEQECEDHFSNTITRDKAGRLVVDIPFNNRKKDLGYSRQTAVKRQLQVENRLRKHAHLKQQYVEFMKEYQALNHMECVPPEELEERPTYTNYLPHHCVINQSSSTTKVRVVFDGSVLTSTGTSFNQTQLVGPTVQRDLYSILICFRLNPIAIKADFKQMFRNFHLTKDQADLHRIVWRDDPSHPMQDFRLLTVTYGTTYAPFEATRCLKEVAIQTKSTHPNSSKALKDETYVDDVMTGASNATNGTRLVKELIESTAPYQLELRKWASNDPTVLERIPPEHKEIQPCDFKDDTISLKALGVQWHPACDQFRFKYQPLEVPSSSSVLTKRSVLSELARVFDPLGLIAAVTVRAKILMQSLWKLHCDWDDAVPDQIKEEWFAYLEDLKEIANFSVPRYVLGGSGARLELHGFSDASEKAYGVAIYLRIIEENSVNSFLLTSKSKVAPIRQVSLPRLELAAAVMLAEVVDIVRALLNRDIPIFLYTDSTITLCWIRGDVNRWKTFVANRVSIVQDLTSKSWWSHVPGVHYPADLVSRGVTASNLVNNPFWTEGAPWLCDRTLPDFVTPHEDFNPLDLEERPAQVLTARIPEPFIERYGTLTTLIRITALLRRVLTQPVLTQPKLPASPAERVLALQAVIRYVQSLHFKNEITILREGRTLPRSSKLRKLYPYLDSAGLLRVSGRLNYASIPEESKHQYILPAKSYLTFLVVRHHHFRTLHGGNQLTYSQVMSEYWIIGGRDKVRHVIHQCTTCKRHRKLAAQQLMGQLPAPRVNEARPFLHTGVDFAGPFTFKNPIGRVPQTYKGYLCIFVCMATKAVHLEAVSSLSAEAFLETFFRFISRRGIAAHLYCDQGTNFVGADGALQKLFASAPVQHQIASKLGDKGVTFHFNSPASPHHGGLWEAGVKSVKHHLRRVMGASILTFEKFSTLLCEIEAVLNSRPLCPMSPDPSDFSVLTPGHFLIGEPLLAVPQPDLHHINPNRMDQFQKLQAKLQHFWKKWHLCYLNTLQQRLKWNQEEPNLKPGDLVLLIESTPPSVWKMGRVVKVHPGKDNLVRVVDVETQHTKENELDPLTRPIILTATILSPCVT